MCECYNTYKYQSVYYYYHYYHHHFMALWILSRTTWVGRYQKSKIKTNLDFLEQETVSGSGISWAICKYAPHPRHITMPAPDHSFLQARCPSCCLTNSIKALNTSISILHITHTQPFYGSVDFVRDKPGELVPEETFTHSHPSCK